MDGARDPNLSLGHSAAAVECSDCWSSHLAIQKATFGCRNEQTATALVSVPLQSLTMDAVGIEATSPP